MTTLSVLVSGLEAELQRLGYKDSTLVWYRGCWRRMQKYFAARGIEEFSLDVAMTWVDDACGFFGKERAGTLKQTDVYLFRVAQMLEDYRVHGAVLRRYSRSVSKLDTAGAEVIARFQDHLRVGGRSVSTVRTYGTLAGEFLAFTGPRGGLGCCDAAMIGAFVATLSGYQFKTVEQKLCAVRSLLRFAAGAGLVDETCLQAVPAARSAKQTRIPSVWDPGEVAAIVAAIDRDNPCGKRDYAIILLITRLGLRGVDIKRLEFADFDWPGNQLFVTQSKTGHRVQLPLLKQVGWAVIDYIRHGRPDWYREYSATHICSSGTVSASCRNRSSTMVSIDWRQAICPSNTSLSTSAVDSISSHLPPRAQKRARQTEVHHGRPTRTAPLASRRAALPERSVWGGVHQSVLVRESNAKWIS